MAALFVLLSLLTSIGSQAWCCRPTPHPKISQNLPRVGVLRVYMYVTSHGHAVITIISITGFYSTWPPTEASLVIFTRGGGGGRRNEAVG